LARHRVKTLAIIAAAAVASATPVSAATLAEVLAAAYANNPTLNAARAELRATDEGVPQARSGYRPTVFGSADAAATYTDSAVTGTSTTYPRGVGLSVEQPIFLGFRTKNSVKGAESAVLAGREVLRDTEQAVLLDAVTAFMDVAQAQAILSLRSQNLEFLREQVRAANDRLNVGEGTRTDVAQTNARLSAGLYEYSAAAATVTSAGARYQAVIGRPPDTIGAVKSVDALLPRTLDEAIAKGRDNHPAILAAGFNIDVSSFNVKVIEGEFLPRITIEGDATHRNGGSGGATDSASIVGRVTVPIYQAGEPDARARAAKETLGQRRIELDLTRDQVRQNVVAFWSALEAAKAQIRSADATVEAQQLVLSGVIEERNVGQRTTLDVLDAQADLLVAREAQVVARRERVVAAYSLLASVGNLSASKLGLAVAAYNPKEHYRQVRDKWGGLRTPDGR
jgi:outer membrane protein